MMHSSIKYMWNSPVNCALQSRMKNYKRTFALVQKKTKIILTKVSETSQTAEGKKTVVTAATSVDITAITVNIAYFVAKFLIAFVFSEVTLLK